MFETGNEKLDNKRSGGISSALLSKKPVCEDFHPPPGQRHSRLARGAV